MRASWGTRFDRYVRNNVAATQRLLEAAQAAPGARFVYASSSSVYGDAERLPTPEDATPRPLSPYGVTKLAAEQLCRLYHANHGVDAVALRYFTVYGPRQRPDMAFRRFCEAALAGEPIRVFGDGRQTRDFTFVADVVAATRAAGDARGVGGARLQRRRRRPGEPQLTRSSGWRAIAGRPLDVRRSEPRVRRRAAHGRRHRRARAATLGYEPATDLATGLAAEFDWVRARTAATAGSGLRSLRRCEHRQVLAVPVPVARRLPRRVLAARRRTDRRGSPPPPPRGAG